MTGLIGWDIFIYLGRFERLKKVLLKAHQGVQGRVAQLTEESRDKISLAQTALKEATKEVIRLRGGYGN